MSRFFFRHREKTRQPPARRWELDESRYAEYLRALQSHSPVSEAMDERTWSDLEMDKTFLRLDRSLTPCGSQYLYCQLRNYPRHEEQEKARTIQKIIEHSETAQNLASALEVLNYKEAADLAGFVFRDAVPIPQFYWLCYVLSAFTIALTVGVFFQHWLFLPLVGLWIINLVLSARYGRTFAPDAPALGALYRLLVAARKLQKLEPSQLTEISVLREHVPAAERMEKKVRWVALRPVTPNDIIDAAFEYLNILCLFEITCSFRAAVAIRGERKALCRIFESVARLDALRGLAVSLAEYPFWCHAKPQAEGAIKFEDVYHPLIAKAVPNSIQTEKSLLISGTNMAGKTTFVKTVASNIILAQALGVCLARTATVSPMRVKALIKRDDTVAVNQSYFFGEAKELLAILREAELTGQPHLLVIDEIFRGTNSLERIAAGKAVLSHLADRMLVIATTHDTELSTLLREKFDSCHFSEKVAGAEIEFDYLLKQGPCVSRNAIRLLVMAGYPQEVIDAADAIINSKKLTDTRLAQTLPQT